jgi:hypothetical protein
VVIVKDLFDLAMAAKININRLSLSWISNRMEGRSSSGEKLGSVLGTSSGRVTGWSHLYLVERAGGDGLRIHPCTTTYSYSCRHLRCCPCPEADAGATACKDVAAACNAIAATLHGTATAAVAAVTAAEAIGVDYVLLMLPSLYFLGWLLLLRLHLHYLLGQELGLLMSARLPHLNTGFFLFPSPVCVLAGCLKPIACMRRGVSTSREIVNGQ